MALRFDYGLDANGDLDIEDNDVTYVLSDEDHIEDTILAAPLWWKQFPADGVGIRYYLASTGKVQKLMGSIKQQLQADGYICNNPVVGSPLVLPNGNLNINPNATML